MTDFEKGAEAMRERIGLRIAHLAYVENWHPRREQELTDAIRDLPLPVQPPGSESREARLDGVSLIAAERKRQVEEEGWTAEHDAEHAEDALSLAAACYAIGSPRLWPWDIEWWKPTNRVRDLVKAGALIAAAIDRAFADARPSPSSEKQRGDKT